ncbi:hypothetical protein BDN72DRAFT_905129 [Pluteus cervinus]|uniref:Uncharacterized protein n=1 Tax=Pluteus cervinus TaxID=181527 RepID=A0ACD3A306_9AGAR|nr:hypothetical protein BDN72DRAFT_905129 [Pluteus cervinus]
MSSKKSFCLRKELHFPPLSGIPEYYCSNSGHCDANYNPLRRWCLLAEILSVEKFVSLVLRTRDSEGRLVTVSLSLPDYTDVKEICKVGHTVAIMFPYRNTMVDGTVGIKLSSLERFEVIQSCLDDLVKTSDKMKCVGCCSTCGGPTRLGCDRCQMPFCGKGCLSTSWKLDHKAECEPAQFIRRWRKMDWEAI